MTTAEVLAALAAERPLEVGSGPWTVRFIDTAHHQFGGAWTATEIDGTAALDIVVPPHAGEPCRGDRLELIGRGGARVEEAATTLAAMRAQYEANNNSCWSRIARAAEAPFSTVILSAAPLDSDDHRDLDPRTGSLFHIDGFHRLVGWAMAERLVPAARIRAIVAGVSQDQLCSGYLSLRSRQVSGRR